MHHSALYKIHWGSVTFKKQKANYCPLKCGLSIFWTVHQELWVSSVGCLCRHVLDLQNTLGEMGRAAVEPVWMSLFLFRAVMDIHHISFPLWQAMTPCTGRTWDWTGFPGPSAIRRGGRTSSPLASAGSRASPSTGLLVRPSNWAKFESIYASRDRCITHIRSE